MQYLIWKVSINVSNISGRQERGSMDSMHQAKLKTTYFTSYRANQTNTFLPECRLPALMQELQLYLIS